MIHIFKKIKMVTGVIRVICLTWISVAVMQLRAVQSMSPTNGMKKMFIRFFAIKMKRFCDYI